MWLCFHAFLTYFCLVPHYLFLVLSLSLCWTCNNCCCLQAGSQMSQTRVLFSDFSGCFSSSAFHYFSSLVQVQLFGCIVIMFAIKLMKSFALLPINLCFPLSFAQCRLKVRYLIVQFMPRSKLACDKLIPNFNRRQQIAFHFVISAHFCVAFPLLFFHQFYFPICAVLSVIF